VPVAGHAGVSDAEYRRRIRAWCMYDWANSAFATTILAAVLPVYYSRVAGETLPSEAVATQYWAVGLSVALFVVAVISPILGTISDLRRGKKPMLAISAGVGIVGTGLLALAGSGDWLLASIFFVVGRIGFGAALIFYDSLLPHVAREEDQDRVSSLGYALGYLGGGILLAINAVMIIVLGEIPGSRLSFLSVAVWWAVFTIPVLRRVPEPPAVTAGRGDARVVRASFRRLGETFRHLRQYRQLLRFLIAFLIYADGIGTIIGVAAIYGAELGFGMTELILALLLVQFVGIPYSLIFGRLPSKTEKRRPFFLAFVIFNLVALPLVGLLGARLLPADISGSRPPAYTDTATAVGEGLYPATSEHLIRTGEWQTVAVSADELGAKQGADYLMASEPWAMLDFPFNGQKVELLYSTGPDYGKASVLVDGQALNDKDGNPIYIDAYSATQRYDVDETFEAPTPGEHVLTLVDMPEKDPSSRGNVISVRSVKVLPPVRLSNLGLIIGLIVVVELVGLAFAALLGKPLFSRMADKIDTQRGILLALVMYSVIAVWGFFLDSVVEFWFLAWMVAIVQGGSQALSRSLFASMAPASKSGEFFGLFGIMEKFSAVFGPLIFAWAAATFNSSRPAVLSLIAFFIVGGYLLTRVNVAEGRKVAQEDDARLLQ
jgi:UMF1 family MFS transporter